MSWLWVCSSNKLTIRKYIQCYLQNSCPVFHVRPKAPVQDISGLSPGEQSQLKHLQHLMARPNHPVARDLLNHYYHLPLNVPQDQSREAGTKGKVMTGTTVEHLTTLPRTNRRNAMVRAAGRTGSFFNVLCV